MKKPTIKLLQNLRSMIILKMQGNLSPEGISLIEFIIKLGVLSFKEESLLNLERKYNQDFRNCISGSKEIQNTKLEWHTKTSKRNLKKGLFVCMKEDNTLENSRYHEDK